MTYLCFRKSTLGATVGEASRRAARGPSSMCGEPCDGWRDGKKPVDEHFMGLVAGGV